MLSLADVPLNPADYHPGLTNVFLNQPGSAPEETLNAMERTFMRLGLGKPIPRALVLGGITTLAVSAIQPGFAFDEYGPREFGFGNGIVGEDGRNPSLFNWWSCGVIVAGLSLVFT